MRAPHPSRSAWRRSATVLTLVAVVGVIAAAVAATAGGESPRRASSASTPRSTTAAARRARPAGPPVPLRVVSRAPHGTVAGDAVVRVRFSAPLAPLSGSPAPRIAPSTPGRWSEPTPTTLQFTPTGAYLPGTVVTVTIPKGLRGAGGGRLQHAVRVKYTAAGGSSQRLGQLLAQLRYLPMHFVSRARVPAGDAAAQQRAVYAPPKGRLRFGHGWPARLHELWVHNQALVLQGAVRAFESQHGLTMDGAAGPQVWRALLAARAHNQFNNAGYSYAVASEASPETLTVYHNGHVVVRTPANTGVAGAPTALGTYPVYERLRSQTMKGTNLDGSHYADFVQWVAYFNGGDAVHYMPRSSYGSPQSLGCVEVPYAAAQRAWGYLTYGTLVSVVG